MGDVYIYISNAPRGVVVGVRGTEREEEEENYKYDTGYIFLLSTCYTCHTDREATIFTRTHNTAPYNNTLCTLLHKAHVCS
jgi:hypothetical protein